MKKVLLLVSLAVFSSLGKAEEKCQIMTMDGKVLQTIEFNTLHSMCLPFEPEVQKTILANLPERIKIKEELFAKECKKLKKKDCKQSLKKLKEIHVRDLKRYQDKSFQLDVCFLTHVNSNKLGQYEITKRFYNISANYQGRSSITEIKAENEQGIVAGNVSLTTNENYIIFDNPTDDYSEFKFHCEKVQKQAANVNDSSLLKEVNEGNKGSAESAKGSEQ